MKLIYVFLFLLLTACVENGDPETLFQSGKYEKAFELWKPRAESGNALSQNYLGIHYYVGLGTTRNMKAAKEWFEKAALNGYADAQYNLGVMYENGEFVEQDYSTAYMWFFAANHNGNNKSAIRMQAMADEHKLFPNQMNRAVDQAREYLNK